jgi:DNA-binding NarL/FixJ family response regulator
MNQTDSGGAERKRVLCVCSDMIFAARITGLARAAGCDLTLIRDPRAVEPALAEPAATVIVDLNAAGDDPVNLIRRILDRDHPPQVVAYLSHVQADLAAAARAAGASEVLARSAVQDRLPRILAP